DFGIAAFTAPRDGAESTSLRLTAENAVIGTVGYMSPEQAQGKSCDHRSDLFSLGAVLYEMLAGSPAFPGDTALAAFLAVINLEPAPLESLCPAASPLLARLVHRCLDKDPGRRFQSASDLAFHLESLGLAPVPSVSLATPGASVRRRRGLLLAGAVAALLLAVDLLAGILVERRWGHDELPSFQRLTFRRGSVVNARFAPDGQAIVYSAFWDGRLAEIFTTRIDSPESRSLGLPYALFHSISPRGEMLIGLTQVSNGSFVGYTLARMPLAGGAPRPFLESREPHWVDWAPDGETVAQLRFGDDGTHIEYPRGKAIWRSENYAWDLRVAPAGDALAFCEDRGGSQHAVVMLDRAGKVEARSDGWSTPAYLEWVRRGCVAWGPDGKELWFAAARPGKESGLYALTREGKVRPLLRVPGELALYDVARDGRVLLTQVNRRTALVARAPGETQERNLSWFESSELADLSADGRWVLFTESGQGGGERTSVYLRGTDGSPAVRLGDGRALALSPDGHWALARSTTDPKRLFLLPTGAGEPQVLPPTSMDVIAAQWMPGGRELLIVGTEPGKGLRLYLMPVGAKAARPFARPGVNSVVPSPDGSRVAVSSLDGLKIYPAGGGEPSAVPGFRLGEEPIQWRADGRALYLARFNESG
ncbi:MAG TPA: protein kinase, partial [Thermoanaerobaculia bacterium]